ncbi:right-handed parallel beta-helix repeat-containing protein [Mucilaginibacter sp. RS28]|uniref:Right-handed parallel beta-helix repeat-containing protein n=1 Tax=Mucilaginibacter straminoryzae TaxID=2932774 RepID=A0A9X2B8S5_9SPHI|nr:right-handed parallel beta-helix repeat-containing protein [Mucilaginibacter straminoryzae]MCJ8209010.1 right-handed parallel beta-helix repeat-containing protein [Mucilaginibacter straminoryzae]
MRKYLPLMLISVALFGAGCKKNADALLEAKSGDKAYHAGQQLNTLSPGTTYYIDPAGADTSSGTSELTPWQSLAKVNATTFNPGDRILFKCGGTWSGQLRPLGSGASGSPIIIDKYGTGNKPVINGPGTKSSAGLLLYNQEYWEINNLEISNYSSAGGISIRGILVTNTNLTVPKNHVYIRNCYIHNVNSDYSASGVPKITGGVILYGYFDDVTVRDCYVKDCATEGLRTYPYGSGATRSTNIKFIRNTVENIYGDGIVLNTVYQALADSNIVHNACMDDVNNFAGCWTFNSIGSVISHNEVYGLTGGLNDGEAFDADTDVDGDIYEYNYSHDNNKGFMLFMPNAKNVIVRYNISANDVLGGTKLIDFKPTGTSNNIYNNVFYITNNITNVFEHAFHGNFKNNVLNASGTVTNFSESAMNSGSVLNNNCFYPTTALTTNWNTGSHSSNVFSSPAFVSPSSYSMGLASAAAFKLSSASPCKTAGVVITNNGGIDYFGIALSTTTNPDIGAIKY